MPCQLHGGLYARSDAPGLSSGRSTRQVATAAHEHHGRRPTDVSIDDVCPGTLRLSRQRHVCSARPLADPSRVRPQGDG